MPLISSQQPLFFSPELVVDINAQCEIGIAFNMDDRIVGINPALDFNSFLFFFSPDPDHAFFKVQGLGEIFFSQYVWAETKCNFSNFQQPSNFGMSIRFGNIKLQDTFLVYPEIGPNVAITHGH